MSVVRRHADGAVHTAWIAAGLVALFVLFQLRVALIAGEMPYVNFYDEPHVTVHALDILKTGDFHPHWFAYPSLPIYLTAGSFAVGMMSAARNDGDIRADNLGEVTYPFYTRPEIVWPAKLLFAAFSVLAMAILAFHAARIYRMYELWLLVPVFCGLSAMYLFSSYKYINVDIAGTFFAVATVSAILVYFERTGILHEAVIPGALAGLAIASKYSYFLILLIPVAAVLLKSPRKIIGRTTVIILVASATFLVAMPYAVLDLPSFLNEMAWSVAHYSTGHLGFSVHAGLNHFMLIIGRLIRDYGLVVFMLGLIGIVWALRRDWKRSLILFSYPLLHMLLASATRILFERNILVAYLFLGVAAAIGFAATIRFIAALLAKPPWPLFRKSAYRTAAATLVLSLTVLLALPWGVILQAYDLRPDSRNLIIEYIRENVEPGGTIVVPVELGLDVRPLKDDYDIEIVPFKWMSFEEREQMFTRFTQKYILQPQYAHEERFPKYNYSAKSLNEHMRARVRPMKRFGTNPVFENYDRPVSNGDPDFFLGRIKRKGYWKAVDPDGES